MDLDVVDMKVWSGFMCLRIFISCWGCVNMMMNDVAP